MIPYCILVIEDESDRAFMEKLYQDYHRLMYSEIVGIVKNEWNAEDVMQSVLIRLIDKLPTIRGLRDGQLVNYIVSTCRNAAVNYLRDRGKKTEVSYEDDLGTPSRGSDGLELEFALIKREELGGLTRIWSRLDARTQYLLEGYYVLEKPMSELGKELGIKRDSVRMALTRARKKAYELLEEELEESR